METKKALNILLEYSRLSITPEFAKEISKAFDLEINQKLVYTSTRYRECPKDPSMPRVCVADLAMDICNRLKVKPNADLLQRANMMSGQGSYVELKTFACVKALAESKNIKIKI